jgi:hypothetical protein
MSTKRRPPDNQLALIDIMSTTPITTRPKKKKPGLAGRTENLERRVTRLEAELALVNGQLERNEDDDL